MSDPEARGGSQLAAVDGEEGDADQRVDSGGAHRRIDDRNPETDRDPYGGADARPYVVGTVHGAQVMFQAPLVDMLAHPRDKRYLHADQEPDDEPEDER